MDLNEMYKIKDMLCKELTEYAKKEKLDMSSLETIDKLSESLWRMCRLIDREEGMGEMYSNASNSYGNSYGGNSYHMPHVSFARGMNARRDSMGRYSSRQGGYSNDDFQMDLQELIQNAPNEYVRNKMMDAMGSV